MQGRHAVLCFLPLLLEGLDELVHGEPSLAHLEVLVLAREGKDGVTRHTVQNGPVICTTIDGKIEKKRKNGGENMMMMMNDDDEYRYRRTEGRGDELRDALLGLPDDEKVARPDLGDKLLLAKQPKDLRETLRGGILSGLDRGRIVASNLHR